MENSFPLHCEKKIVLISKAPSFNFKPKKLKLKAHFEAQKYVKRFFLDILKSWFYVETTLQAGQFSDALYEQLMSSKISVKIISQFFKSFTLKTLRSHLPTRTHTALMTD